MSSKRSRSASSTDIELDSGNHPHQSTDHIKSVSSALTFTINRATLKFCSSLERFKYSQKTRTLSIIDYFD